MTTRRSGSETRVEILRVALELFTRQGFEGTSIRDIAEALGMTKSSLYHHFAGKDAIVLAVANGRRDELDDLVSWIDQQECDDTLLQRAALRWVDSATPERLDGMRFANANRPVMVRLAGLGGGIREGFERIVDHLLPEGAPIAERLQARMAFETVNAALFAATGTAATDQDVLDAARSATLALT